MRQVMGAPAAERRHVMPLAKAAARARFETHPFPTTGQEPAVIVHGVTPILNVSNFEESVAWFTKLGW